MIRPLSLGLVLGAALFSSRTSLAAAPAAEAAEPASDWAFSALGFFYFVPEDDDYLQPSLTTDHHALHLEARYNYEDMRTGSVWGGYNLWGGDELGWTLTPMLGAVFGRSNGIAPGCRGSLSYWRLELYSEGEYLFDFGGWSASFFYNWSELTVAPLEWLRFGIVTQRTRAYVSDRTLQRGMLAGVSYDVASLTAYVLNPDDQSPIVIMAAALSFE
jgi:hypothetical protein